MIGSLLILGFTLSLDNFRTAIALGGLRLTWRRSVQVALVFGLCDGLAPLVGILIGLYWSEAIGSTASTGGDRARPTAVLIVRRGDRAPESSIGHGRCSA